MSETKRWLVVDVGCLECGVPTYLIGRYATDEEAYRVADSQGDDPVSRERRPEYAQHQVLVFDLDDPASYVEPK